MGRQHLNPKVPERRTKALPFVRKVKVEARLGEHRFAGCKGLASQGLDFSRSPTMVLVALVAQRHERAGIEQNHERSRFNFRRIAALACFRSWTS